MTVTVDIQHACSGSVPDAELIQSWVESALQTVTEACELSVRLVDENESANLNAQYRGKAGPTNVLSFPFDSEIVLEPRLLGDLVICAPVVAREAIAQSKVEADHWAHLVVHGCLHLLGYDHIEDVEAEEMEALETQILKSLAINDPYQEQGDET